MFYFCRLDLLSLVFLSLPNLRGHLADLHQTLIHGRWLSRFIKFGQKFGLPLTPEIWQPKHQIARDFAQLRDLMVNISRTQQDIIRQSENGVANYGHSAQANLIWYTLVYRRLKI